MSTLAWKGLGKQRLVSSRTQQTSRASSLAQDTWTIAFWLQGPGLLALASTFTGTPCTGWGLGPWARLLTPQLLEATSCPCPLISPARLKRGSCPLPPNGGQRQPLDFRRGVCIMGGCACSFQACLLLLLLPGPLPKTTRLLLSCSSAFHSYLWSSQLRSTSQLASLIWCPCPLSTLNFSHFDLFSPSPLQDFLPPWLYPCCYLYWKTCSSIFTYLNSPHSSKPVSNAAFSKKSSLTPQEPVTLCLLIDLVYVGLSRFA